MFNGFQESVLGSSNQAFVSAMNAQHITSPPLAKRLHQIAIIEVPYAHLIANNARMLPPRPNPLHNPAKRGWETSLRDYRVALRDLAQTAYEVDHLTQ